MRNSTAAGLFGTVAAIALLAGCASRPQVSAQQESSRYLSRAERDYTPPGSSRDPWGPYISEAAGKYDVPEKWIREVMRQESGGKLYGRNGSLVTSGAGAMGLMQVMPATYDDLRLRYRELGDDPFDPHNNILAGSAYIREMYDIYGAPGFLAAYNAGPGRLDDYLTRNRTLPLETRRYVAAIGPRISGYDPQKPSPGAMYAMNAMPLDIPAGPRYPSDTQFASAAPTAPSTPIVLRPQAPIYSAPAPVEVAEAPSGNFIKLSPQPDPAPYAVADATPSRSFITLSPPAPSSYASPSYASPSYANPVTLPAPVAVADARPAIKLNAPTPMQFAEAPRYEPAPSRFQTAAPRTGTLPLPEPPAPPPSTGYSQFARRGAAVGNRPIEVAEFPEPPRIPTRYAAAQELVPLNTHSHGFSLIPGATAAPIHRGAAPFASATGGWAVQVGAFANPNQAQSATAAARQNARDVLGGAQTLVAGVHQSGGTLYRARLGGLSHNAAAEACERLSRTRTNCMVVSPDAQR